MSAVRGVYTDDGRCVSRDAWIAASELNYVAINFNAKTYADGDALPTDAEELCKFEGASLIDGRICTCSTTDPAKMYLNLQNFECIAAPEVPDGSVLTHLFLF